MWVCATSLFRAVAAGLFLLIALALSSTSAFACDERDELPAAAQANLALPTPHLLNARVGTVEIAMASRLVQTDADDNCAGCPCEDHDGHCPCGGSHCCWGATAFMASSSVGLLIRFGSSQSWTAPQAFQDGLRRTPDDRPPRLI